MDNPLIMNLLIVKTVACVVVSGVSGVVDAEAKSRAGGAAKIIDRRLLMDARLHLSFISTTSIPLPVACLVLASPLRRTVHANHGSPPVVLFITRLDSIPCLPPCLRLDLTRRHFARYEHAALSNLAGACVETTGCISYFVRG